MQRAQDLGDHGGKILRLTDEGKPAKSVCRRSESAARDLLIAHCNVQGAALHPTTGVLWASEHGPQGGDELNLVRAGVNYGWPVITYGVNYGIGTPIGEGSAKEGMAQPQKHWIPSPALSGMAFYQGDRFPKWRGNILLGALKSQALIRVRLDGERVVEDEIMLRGKLARIRDVRVGPDGHVYLLSDSRTVRSSGSNPLISGSSPAATAAPAARRLRPRQTRPAPDPSAMRSAPPD
jgi:glucose/arabinose dehydrogenase